MRSLAQISLINYPGKIAATLFFPGCNFRCGYCHNPDLVHAPKKISGTPYLSFVKKNVPIFRPFA
ncbi:MAG: pyruvate formate lyase activating enzyme [Candidatus Marinamargulisbacteria bacterium]|jgi:pyruvate formate lyase activating enzyme